ncbi:MAG: polysaccharide deacetylase family protein [Alphaproteobacteria bacterium]|nr:polysaccharide deacetylase family protein [Alphaproteobacteria bacterium]
MTGRIWQLVWGLLLGALCLAPAAPVLAQGASEGGAVILMYHRFGEADYPSTNIQVAQIDAHLEMLREGGFTILPLPDIVAAFERGETLPDRTIAITIDDAFRSIYDVAWPKFQAAGVPFTVFVATDLVDRGHSNYMTWDQIRVLHSAGVTIGNHSVSHPHMPDQDLAVVRREIETAQKRLTEELGEAPTLFAYPYGEASQAIAEMVGEMGFKAALGQHSAVAFAAHDRYYMPRFALNENFGAPDRFDLIVNALPLPVSDVTPADPMLRVNPPPFGFTVAPPAENLASINCFAFAQGSAIDLTLQQLGGTRIEVRFAQALPPGRARINCTMPAEDGRWRWFGMQYYVRAR